MNCSIVVSLNFICKGNFGLWSHPTDDTKMSRDVTFKIGHIILFLFFIFLIYILSFLVFRVTLYYWIRLLSFVRCSFNIFNPHNRSSDSHPMILVNVKRCNYCLFRVRVTDHGH